MKVPITYTGTNTNNLYVLGLKNGKPVKLKVRDLSCHGGIITDPICENEEYTSSSILNDDAEAGKLINNTVYIVHEGGIEKRFLYFDNSLIPLTEESKIITGLNYGTEYKTYSALYTDKENLKDNTIYTVSDKGTREQYLYKEGNLNQIGNSINEITEGNSDDLDEVSSTEYVEGGIIDYNMPELVNGDYRYKNHKELTTVICDMPSLKSGYQMFMGTSLVGFCGDLSSLEDGRDMFRGCNLEENSIINIIDSIPYYISGEHILTITYDASISNEIINELVIEAEEKGWNIQVEPFNG